jgi:glycosyltransferase involved in cell wall biosynthesis
MQPDRLEDIVILIPAYNPGPELAGVIRALRERGFAQFVVVNDGSLERCRTVFAALADFGDVHLTSHDHNKGKGAALKTGFRFIRTLKGCPGVITVDADGQHLPSDIERLAKASVQNRQDVILGTRSFTERVPLRSRFGNKLTALLLRTAYGISLEDTQTGLRYIPNALLDAVTSLPGDGYEFELEFLLEVRNLGITIRQLPIETVYIDGNASSHFRPIVDSLRIYRVLFRFTGSSGFCFVVDISLFSVFIFLTRHVMVSTFAARTVSGAVNFAVNKSYVFRKGGSGTVLRESGQYLALWIVIALLSGSMVSMVKGFQAPGIIIVKIAVDLILFFLSFHVQNTYIFGSRRSLN